MISVAAIVFDAATITKVASKGSDAIVGTFKTKLGNILLVKNSGRELGILLTKDFWRVIEYKSFYLVLLSIPYSDKTINIIFCLDSKVNMIWRAEDLSVRFPEMKKLLPYEQMGIKDNILYASDFYGRSYQINVDIGKIEGIRTVK